VTAASLTISRPVLRYHGGKYKIAPWIVAHLPPHRVYVEPFGGAASVLLRKPRSYGEVYNDRDDMVVSFFRVLRDPAAASELARRVTLTPYARSEFAWSYLEPLDAIDQAHRLVMRSFMGFGSASMTRTHRTGFRSNSNRSGTTPAHDWVNWPEHVAVFTERLRGVVIENRLACEVMAQNDTVHTLHYVDPPYVHSTRSMQSSSSKHCYRHEMDDSDHAALLAQLQTLVGMVVVSGYSCRIYDDALAGWRRLERSSLADGARPRTEVLWLNPAAAEALPAELNLEPK
jgi:DNA adenine methylase